MGFNKFANEKKLIDKAKKFATEKHKNDKRKGGLPYIVHPEAVAKLVEKYSGTPEMIAAAWLHDVVEDTDATNKDIKKLFGNKIAQLVDELTNPKNVDKSENKTQYIAKKLPIMSRDSLTIKLCDRLDNVSDLEKFENKKYALNTKIILDALEDSRRPLTPQQKILVAEIRKMIAPYENN